jgi:serine/threonine protein phosphatase PrpC
MSSRQPLDISIPPDVQVAFGRAQTLYGLAARVAPLAPPTLLSGAPPAPRPELGYSPLGDWDRISVGSLVLHKLSERDYPLHEAELAAIGLPRPVALFRLAFERSNQLSAPPEDWQAMLAIMCGLARETEGILYQPPGEAWRDFAEPPGQQRASRAFLQKSAIPTVAEAAARDDIGTDRNHNEDRAGVFPEIGLAVVADGMGGQHTGDVAAEIAVSTLEKCLRQTNYYRVCGPSWEAHWLVQAIRLASVRIAARSYSYSWENPTLNHRSLGAAVAAALAVEGGVLIAHVGDARVYRLREGSLSALTSDHTLMNEQPDTVPPDLPPETLAIMKNVLTRSLGSLDTPRVDARFEALAPGDLFFLCTDGLHRVLSDAEIEERLRREQPLARTCEELILDANKRGTPDNLSAALVRWHYEVSVNKD